MSNKITLEEAVSATEGAEQLIKEVLETLLTKLPPDTLIEVEVDTPHYHTNSRARAFMGPITVGIRVRI